MAQIPMGNFGYKQAQLSTGVVQAPNGADKLAAIGMAETISGIAESEMAKAAKEKDDASRGAALLAEARATNRKDLLNRDMQSRVDAGDDIQTVKQEYEKNLSQIDDEEYSSIHEKYKAPLVAQSERQKGLGLMAIDGHGQKFQQKRLAGDLDALGDETLKMAAVDPVRASDRYAAAIDVLGESAGIDDKRREDAKQKFSSRAWTEHATQRILSADEKQLEQLHDEVAKTDGEFSALDPQSRMTLQNQIYSRIQHNRAVKSAEAQAALVGASQEVSATMDNIRSGVQISPQSMQRAEAQAQALGAKNPAILAQWEATKRNMPVWTELNTSTLASQEQRADVMMKEAMTDRGRGPVYQQSLVAQAEHAQQLVAQNITKYRNDPYGYIEEKTGRPAPPVDFMLMMNPAPEAQVQFNRQIDERMKYAGAGHALTGKSPGLLTKQEVDFVTDTYEKGGIEIKKSMITALSSMQQSDEMVQRTLGEISKKNPVLTQIVAYERSGTMTKSKAPMSDLILRGSIAVEKNKDMKLAGVEDKLFNEEFNRASGVAMFAGRDEIRSAALEAAKSAYYGLKAQHGDYTGTRNKDMATDAITAALGNPVKFNGQHVPPPPGMDQAAFKEAAKSSLSKLWADLNKAGAIGLPKQSDFVSDNVLQILPDGKYRVLYSNGGPFYAEFKDKPRGNVALTISGKGTKP